MDSYFDIYNNFDEFIAFHEAYLSKNNTELLIKYNFMKKYNNIRKFLSPNFNDFSKSIIYNKFLNTVELIEYIYNGPEIENIYFDKHNIKKFSINKPYSFLRIHVHLYMYLCLIYEHKKRVNPRRKYCELTLYSTFCNRCGNYITIQMYGDLIDKCKCKCKIT